MNIVNLEISLLEEDFVFLVLLDQLPLVKEQLNVNHAHVVIQVLQMEPLVNLAQQVNILHQLEEIVLFVQSEQSVIQLDNVGVLNVDLELNQMEL